MTSVHATAFCVPWQWSAPLSCHIFIHRVYTHAREQTSKVETCTRQILILNKVWSPGWVKHRMVWYIIFLLMTGQFNPVFEEINHYIKFIHFNKWKWRFTSPLAHAGSPIFTVHTEDPTQGKNMPTTRFERVISPYRSIRNTSGTLYP